MEYRGRFAPSPTGDLHLGSLVAALGSWLRARQAGGRWLLRIEDIDPPREIAGAADRIVAALADHRLSADAPVLFQSRRRAAYDLAFERLRAGGGVFPCACSRTQLATQGGLHRDGRCLADADAQCAPKAWRLRVGDARIAFHDAVFGSREEYLADTAGDFVIRRNDGFYSYQFAVVVDDAFQGITEVVRGADLLESTARQIFLQQALGLPTPDYVHLPVIVDGQGRKLGKSAGTKPLPDGDPRPALRTALGLLGVKLPTQSAKMTADALLAFAVEHFDLRHLDGTSPPADSQ